jgi:sialidase-1
LTWQPLVNLTSQMVRGGFSMLNPGPGTGIQTSSGRLLVPAWGSRIGVPKGKPPCVGGCDRFWATNIYSDDGGATWQITAPVPNPLGRKPNELQAAQLLPNSSIVLNVRDEDGPERLLARSDTDGDTWGPLEPTPYLVGSICQGSTVSVSGVLFFSHPFDKTTRANGWIKFSVDAGHSWWLWRQVVPSSFSYSAMTLMDVNETHVSLGVVYEAGEEGHMGATSLYWTVVTDFLPQVAGVTRA